MRRIFVATIIILGLALGTAMVGLHNARRDPIVRRAIIGLIDWPAGARPISVALLSDIHLGNASTGPERLARIIRQVNARRPDLVLIAGDFVAGDRPEDARRSAPALTAALRGLRAPLGVVAVLGNHDNWSDSRAVGAALAAAGVVVVENGAVRRGPLVIGGSGDTVSGHAKLGGALNAMRRLLARSPGARVYLSHSPDIVRWLPPGPALLLAGHTHCGQIVLPVIGSLAPVSRLNGNRYRCGIVVGGAQVTIVSGGIGTSIVPLRFGAPPDWWLLTLDRAH